MPGRRRGRPPASADVALRALMLLGLAGLAGLGLTSLARAKRRSTGEPNRHTRLAQMDGTPLRRYYTGPLSSRARAIADLRARAHQLMPRLALEYLEAGAEDEASMMRERG